MKISLLINMKMPTIVGIFIFISKENFMLSWVELEKCCTLVDLIDVYIDNCWTQWVVNLTADPGVRSSNLSLGIKLLWCLIRNYFLLLFSPFHWFKKVSCQYWFRSMLFSKVDLGLSWLLIDRMCHMSLTISWVMKLLTYRAVRFILIIKVMQGSADWKG